MSERKRMSLLIATMITSCLVIAGVTIVSLYKTANESPCSLLQGDSFIELSDNGCGMDQETMSKIFNPFFTTKAPGEGTGLGLYLCLDLAKDLGGRIEVQSEPGKGSIFRVVLPDDERRSAKRV